MQDDWGTRHGRCRDALLVMLVDWPRSEVSGVSGGHHGYSQLLLEYRRRASVY